MTHPNVGVFILVTGDSDYTPLVTRLREHGKQVVGVGTETSASRRLVSVCSQYKYWGTLVSEVNPATREAVAAAFDIADAEQLLVRAFEQITTDTPTASAIKTKMRSLDPAFDEANYGCRSFRDFLAKLHHRVRMVGDSGLDKTYALIDIDPLAATS